jgi:hypothetical protein
MRLVKDRILHVWEQRRAEAKDRTAEKRVKVIQQKLDRLDEAFLFAQSIDATSYERQRDRLREELTLAQICAPNPARAKSKSGATDVCQWEPHWVDAHRHACRDAAGHPTFVVRTSVPSATLAQPVVAAIHAIDPDPAGRRDPDDGAGTRRADVLRLVIVEGMSPALLGIAAGTIAPLVSARVVRTLVFGVSASDPLTLAAVGATLTLVALMASLMPAFRALRVDPVKVLRAN